MVFIEFIQCFTNNSIAEIAESIVRLVFSSSKLKIQKFILMDLKKFSVFHEQIHF